VFAGVAEQLRAAVCPFEVQVGVVLPGDGDPAEGGGQANVTIIERLG
jgi:hypothetical protein